MERSPRSSSEESSHPSDSDPSDTAPNSPAENQPTAPNSPADNLPIINSRNPIEPSSPSVSSSSDDEERPQRYLRRSSRLRKSTSNPPTTADNSTTTTADMAWNPGFPGNTTGGWDPNAPTTTTGSTGWSDSQSWSQSSQSSSQGFASWPAGSGSIRPQAGGHPTASNSGMSHSFSSSQLCHRPGFQEQAAPGGSSGPSSSMHHMAFQSSSHMYSEHLKSESYEEHRQISRTTERVERVYETPAPGEISIDKYEPGDFAQNPPRTRRVKLRDIMSKVVKSALSNSDIGQEADRFNKELSAAMAGDDKMKQEN